jgi:PIN domain nuclease of toxin-antitoxin system
MTHYILDACALLSLQLDEPGSETISEIYHEALVGGSSSVAMNITNLLEVYYILYRQKGKNYADSTLDKITNSQITINREMSQALFSEAGRIKASYSMSLAKPVALAQAIISNGALITSDREFKKAEENKESAILWLK